MVTLPKISALGATQALGAIRGTFLGNFLSFSFTKGREMNKLKHFRFFNCVFPFVQAIVVIDSWNPSLLNPVFTKSFP